MAKVENMKSGRGYNRVANQFIITEEGRGSLGNFITMETFQSYDTVIAVRIEWKDDTTIELDINNWEYSHTTGKYRNQFLGETKKETEEKIKAGIYRLVDLNH